jgi:hypothetical protein
MAPSPTTLPPFTYAAAAQHGAEAAEIALDEVGIEFARTLLSRMEAASDPTTSPDYIAGFRAVVGEHTAAAHYLNCPNGPAEIAWQENGRVSCLRCGTTLVAMRAAS